MLYSEHVGGVGGTLGHWKDAEKWGRLEFELRDPLGLRRYSRLHITANERLAIDEKQET